MKTSKLIGMLLGATVVLSAAVQAGGFPEKTGYLIDSRGNVVRDNFGECWKTGYWTPAMAIAECDASLVPAPAKTVTDNGPQPPVFAPATLRAETLFDFDKAVLREEGKQALNEFVGKMKENPNVEVVLVTGHTDQIGSDKYNQKLSERRANAVKAYMVSQGVEANRIQTKGMGEKEPVVSLKECKGSKGKKALIACLQPNRRVVIEITMQKPAK